MPGLLIGHKMTDESRGLKPGFIMEHLCDIVEEVESRTAPDSITWCGSSPCLKVVLSGC